MSDTQRNISVDMWKEHNKEYANCATELRALGVSFESLHGSPCTDTLIFYNCTNIPAVLPSYYAVEEGQRFVGPGS